MNRIIGDRTKSALDEMEEVARARNADVAEEERLEAEIKARKEELRKKEEAKSGKAPSGKTPAGNITAADYMGIEFEANVSRDIYNKKLYPYDLSLRKLKAAGYKRHASPSEVFSLLMDNLEGKLQGEYKAVAEDMLDDYGEWMSMAVERIGDTLTCYLHPEGLAWDKDKKIYWRKGIFKYDSRQEFDISGKGSACWIQLQKFSDDFVKMLYGRSYKDLPEDMREQVLGTDVYLPPPDGDIWPVYRNNINPFSITCYKKDRGASRGVREKPVVRPKKPRQKKPAVPMPASTGHGSLRGRTSLKRLKEIIKEAEEKLGADEE